MRVWAIYSPIMAFCASLGGALVLWLGGSLVADHRLTIGQLVGFILYLVSRGISETMTTLWEALLLVTIVVYIFLQGWRASLIPLLAVPVSLIGTFILFPLFGFSINTLSLFGLVLAIGLVVDDAIVVVEAVERHIGEGLTPKAAAQKAMQEVGGPVVAWTRVARHHGHLHRSLDQTVAGSSRPLPPRGQAARRNARRRPGDALKSGFPSAAKPVTLPGGSNRPEPTDFFSCRPVRSRRRLAAPGTPGLAVKNSRQGFLRSRPGSEPETPTKSPWNGNGLQRRRLQKRIGSAIWRPD
jgi:hypothetical protein